MTNISTFKFPDLKHNSSSLYFYDFVPESKFMLLEKGSLHGLFSGSFNSKIIENKDLWKTLSSEVHSVYYQSQEKSPLLALKNAVKTVYQNHFDKFRDLEINFCSLVNSFVYIVSCGGSGVSVIRHGNMIDILISSSEVVSASGRSLPDDYIVLWNSKFKNKLGKALVLKNTNPKDLLTLFDSKIGDTINNEDQTDILIPGCSLLYFDEGKSVKKNDSIDVVNKRIINSKTFISRLSVPNFILKSFDDKKKVFVNDRENIEITHKRSKKAAIVGSILLVGLILSVVLGLINKKLIEDKAKYSDRLNNAERTLSEAKDLYSLNPERSRELLIESKSIVNLLLDEGVKDKKLDSLVKDISDNENKLLGEFSLNFEDYFNYSLISDKFLLSDFYYENGFLYVLDEKSKLVASININSKRSEIISGPAQIQTAYKIAAYHNKTFILSDDGINRIGDSRINVIDEPISKEDLIAVFAGNFYSLSKDEKMIKRYSGDGEVFNEAKSWLSDSINNSNLSNAVSWVIDGSVWIGSNDGSVSRYIGGFGNKLSIKGVVPILSKITSIYTDENLSDVYILDASENRVVVMNKEESKYKYQFKSNVLSDALGVIYIKDINLLIIVKKDKLLSSDLKGIGN